MLHPDEGTIHAWLDDQLTPEERARLEEHLDQCQECAVHVIEARGLVAAATRIVGALDDVRGGVIPPKSGGSSASPKSAWRVLRLTPMRAALAATVLLATATIFTISSSGSYMRADRSPATPSAADQSVTFPAAAAPAPPLPQHGPPASLSSAQPKQALQPRREAAPGVASRKSALSSPAEQRREVSLSSVVTSTPRADTIHADSLAASTRDVVAANAEAKRGAGAAAGAAQPAPASAAAAPAPTMQRALIGGAPVRSARIVMLPTLEQRAVGCYRIEIDSTRTIGPDLEQFELGRSDTGMGVVRSLKDSGRSDGIISGAGWRSVGRDSVIVVSSSGGGRAQLLFAVADEGQKAGGRFTSAGGTAPVVVLRTKCP